MYVADKKPAGVQEFPYSPAIFVNIVEAFVEAFEGLCGKLAKTVGWSTDLYLSTG